MKNLKITIGSDVSFSLSVLLCNQIKIKNPDLYKTLKQICFLKSLQFIKIYKIGVKGFRPPHPAWGSRHQRVWKADQAAEQLVLLNAEEPISEARDSPAKSPEQRLNCILGYQWGVFYFI